MEKVRILNVMVDSCTMDEAVERIEQLTEERKNAYVVTPNLDHLISLDEDSGFREAYEHADLVLADGISLVLLAKYLRVPLKEKVSGSDLFPRVCSMAAGHGWSLFILGAEPGVAEEAGRRLSEKNPGLVIAGTYSPPPGFENDPEEIENIIRRVREAEPDIMAIAISSMKGEKFICRYREELGVPVTMSIGAAVDFEAGHRKRAPKWVSRIGLEWFYRTLQEPKRIGKRVLRDLAGAVPLIRKYR